MQPPPRNQSPIDRQDADEPGVRVKRCSPVSYLCRSEQCWVSPWQCRGNDYLARA